MKANISQFHSKQNHSDVISHLIVSKETVDKLLDGQQTIIQLIRGTSQDFPAGYITEKKAIELINKKSTWFWQMRKSGKLPFKKIGRTIYYSFSEINSLLENK
jgi:hypothetical protein